MKTEILWIFIAHVMLKNCRQLSFVCLFFVTGISVKVHPSFKLHLSCLLFLVTLSLWKWEDVTRKEELPCSCSSWRSAPQNADQSCSATSVSYITVPIFTQRVINFYATVFRIYLCTKMLSYSTFLYKACNAVYAPDDGGRGARNTLSHT
jgi:hypothetical protein